MAYDRQFVLLTWNFSILGTQEVANTTLHISGDTGFDAASALANLDSSDLAALNTSMRVLMGTTEINWANFSKFEGIKAAAKDVAGHDIAAPKELATGTPASGSATTTVFAQDTIVVSLRTATTFGRANYGRMYLPHSGMTRFTGVPQAADATCAAVAAAAVDFIENVNVVTNTGAEPGGASIMSKAGTGTAKAVTRVAVGNLVDTQRRRRNRLAETYQFDTVTI
jgi:hypothetical protein